MNEFELSTPDGRTLACQEAGPPDGLPVFVHWGTPMGRMLFEDHIADAENKKIRLISFDRPGYGGSSPLVDRRVAAIADDTAVIADAIGAERFATWGISGGGPPALACAALFPTRCTAAAVFAGAAPSDAEGLDWMAGMGEDNVIEYNAAFEGRDKLEPLLESIRRQILESESDNAFEELESLLSPPDKIVMKSTHVGRFVTANMKAGLASSAEGWIEDDLSHVKPWGFQLDAIRIPVLYWHGTQDLMVPTDHGRWFADHIPNVEAHISEVDGHLTLITTRVPEAHAWLLEKSGIVI